MRDDSVPKSRIRSLSIFRKGVLDHFDTLQAAFKDCAALNTIVDVNDMIHKEW